jgi:hypothetical protein
MKTKNDEVGSGTPPAPCTDIDPEPAAKPMRVVQPV